MSTRLYDPEMGPGVRTVRPSGTAAPTSPWLDAPTHDGLWWVLGSGEGADTALLRLTHHHEHLWRIEGFGFEALEALHPAWRYAPAEPPALPVDALPAPAEPAPRRVFSVFTLPDCAAFDEPQEIP